jgi:hypothetical protein
VNNTRLNQVLENKLYAILMAEPNDKFSQHKRKKSPKRTRWFADAIHLVLFGVISRHHCPAVCGDVACGDGKFDAKRDSVDLNGMMGWIRAIAREKY